jgi:hydroxypyruvate reductase
MTQSVLDVPNLQPTAGVIAIPSSDRTAFPGFIQVFRAGHPHPDKNSVKAGQAAKNLLKHCSVDDRVLVLISGGGSALLELPEVGLELEDLHALTDILLRSGLAIQQMNIIRGAISQTKAGGLARMAAPARVVSLILSDVVGDPLSSIASGPTVFGPDRRRHARELLKKAGLWQEIPLRIRTFLAQPGPPRTKAHRPLNVLLAGNSQMLMAAAEAATALGFQTEVLSRQMHGEARQVGRRFARRLKNRRTRVELPTCLLMGGETTVTVTESGKGGRNQEFALAAELEGEKGVVLVSVASDGRDGPTDAAGAMVDGETIARIRMKGTDPYHALAQNNTHAALKAGGALLETGPTGTNVADLVLGLVYPLP